MRASRILQISFFFFSSFPLFASGPTLSLKCTGPVDGTDVVIYAWRLFACLNRPFGPQTQAPGVYWETLPAPADLYCDGNMRNCDPSHKPSLPGAALKSYLEPIQQEIQLFEETSNLPDSQPPALADGQDVRLNETVFTYVADNNLWYLQGQQAAFLKPAQINFPLGAMEIKAYWVPIEEFEKDRYLWRKSSGTQFFGLVSFNIASKTQAQWLWASFEHVDNPKRCAFIPCSSRFSTISGIDRTIQLGLSSELVTLLQAEGLDAKRYRWWLNYRLHGVQTEFVDALGKPTLLGNSILEAAFKNSSSCITCHARATRNFAGQTLTLSQEKNVPGFVGKPQRSWFCDTADKRTYLALDYVWSLKQAKAAPNILSPTPGEIPACGNFDWLPQ